MENVDPKLIDKYGFSTMVSVVFYAHLGSPQKYSVDQIAHECGIEVEVAEQALLDYQQAQGV